MGHTLPLIKSDVTKYKKTSEGHQQVGAVFPTFPQGPSEVELL